MGKTGGRGGGLFPYEMFSMVTAVGMFSVETVRNRALVVSGQTQNAEFAHINVSLTH